MTDSIVQGPSESLSLEDRVGHLSQKAVRGLRVRSALNPMLWLCAIATPLCFTSSYFFREHDFISYALIAIGVLPILISCIGFLFFMFKQPEKLQSEDYQLQHETLQIIQVQSRGLRLDPDSMNKILSDTLNRKRVNPKDP